MRKEEVCRKIAQELTTKFDVPDDMVIGEDSDLATDLWLDSLDIVELAYSLQKEYQVVLSDYELCRVNTVGELADLIVNSIN